MGGGEGEMQDRENMGEEDEDMGEDRFGSSLLFSYLEFDKEAISHG